MNLKYKTSLVFKISVLLLTLALTVVMFFGIAYGRYLTQITKSLGFSAQPLPQIYYDTAKVSDKTLFQPLQWQSSVNGVSGSFTLCNTANDSEQPPSDDAVFCVRAYVANDLQADATPVEITLSVDDAVYVSKAQNINEKTDFYNKNQKKGQFYCFYENMQAQSQSDEFVFCLKGQQISKITFTLTAYSSEISSDQIFICIEQLK